MHEMMKKMMDNWMKSFEGFKGVGIPNSMDFMQDMDFMKGMNISNIGRQALDFQKLMLDNTYDMLLKMNEQEEKLVDS